MTIREAVNRLLENRYSVRGIATWLVERVEFTPEQEERYRAAKLWRDNMLNHVAVRVKGRPEWEHVQAEIAELKKQAFKLADLYKAVSGRKVKAAIFAQAKKLRLALQAAEERAVEVKLAYQTQYIKTVHYNRHTKDWYVDFNDRYWNAVKMGQIVYFPGDAAKSFYAATVKLWNANVIATKKVLGGLDTQEERAIWLRNLQIAKGMKPKENDPEFDKLGREVEDKNRDKIEAGLSSYFEKIDEIASKYNVTFNHGPLPVSKGALLTAAGKNDPTKMLGAVVKLTRIAWLWAKHANRDPSLWGRNALWQDVYGTSAEKNREDYSIHTTLMQNEWDARAAFNWNNKGLEALEKILAARSRWWNIFPHTKLGDVLDIRVGGVPGKKLGYGARFSADGREMIAFLEPFDVSRTMFESVYRLIGKKFSIDEEKRKGLYAWWLRARLGADEAKKALAAAGIQWEVF